MSKIKICTISIVLLFISCNLSVLAGSNSNFENTTNDTENDLNLLYGNHIFTIYATKDVTSFNLFHIIPLIYEDQAPVFLNIGEETTANIISYKIEDDVYEPNKIINIKIGPMNKGDKAKVHIEYWVLIKNNEFEDLSEYVDMPNEAELPEETKMYLGATESAQSDHPLIKLKAKRLLRKSDGNLREYAENIVEYTHFNRVSRSPFGFELGFHFISTGIPNILYRLNPEKYSHIDKILFDVGFIFPNLEQENINIVIRDAMLYDAVSAYFLGGVCTCVSNLGAALFRANGVPTKQLIVNCDKKTKTNFEIIHYSSEYYCPDYGWVRADSRFSGAKTPLPYNDTIVLKVINPEEENLAGSGMKGNGGLVPFYWLSDEKVCVGKIRDHCWNEGIITVFEDIADNALALTRNVWELFSQYVGKDLGIENNQYFQNAIVAQQDAINCFKESDLDGFFTNLNYAYNELLKIETL